MYLPLVDLLQLHVGKYASPMDPMGTMSHKVSETLNMLFEPCVCRIDLKPEGPLEIDLVWVHTMQL